MKCPGEEGEEEEEEEGKNQFYLSARASSRIKRKTF